MSSLVEVISSLFLEWVDLYNIDVPGPKRPPNKAFSEKRPEVARNASFCCEIATSCPFFVQITRRSLVENERLASFKGTG
jgi:hypothetical protein